MSSSRRRKSGGLEKLDRRSKPKKPSKDIDPQQIPLPEYKGRLVHVSEESFQGPLPPPEYLVRYNDAFAGAAERIVALAEKQTEHRHTLEEAVVRANIANERIGQWFAFIIVLAGMAAGTYLVGAGLSLVGFIAMFAPLTTAAGLFVWARRSRQRELEEKRKQTQSGSPERRN